MNPIIGLIEALFKNEARFNRMLSLGPSALHFHPYPRQGRMVAGMRRKANLEGRRTFKVGRKVRHT